MTDTSANIDEMSFETAYDELESVIARLESGDLSLDDSVTLYERGRQLSAHCQQLLQKAELRIQQIADDGALSA
jgi:exodeoxyribonuclease VII small subunit